MEAAYATMRDQQEIDSLLEDLNTKRVAIKLRVVDLCAMAGISTKTWYQWHSGARRPRVATILKVRNTLSTYANQTRA